MEPPAWTSHGYAVWSALAATLLGAWMLWRGARAWPGALWRRVRGVAYVPGELLKTYLWIGAGVLIAGVGAGAIALEWGLREFQSFNGPTLAGQLQIVARQKGLAATWSDPTGRWSREWQSSCARLMLEGEFVEWGPPLRRAGFRDRHRVAAAFLSCGGSGEAASQGVRLRGESPAWEFLRRWDRFLPGLRVERYFSPALRTQSGSWQVFVMPRAYAFSESE